MRSARSIGGPIVSLLLTGVFKLPGSGRGMATLVCSGLELYVNMWGDGKGGYVVNDMSLRDTDRGYTYARKNPHHDAYINVHKRRPFYGYKMMSDDTSTPAYVTLTLATICDPDQILFYFTFQCGSTTGASALYSRSMDDFGPVDKVSRGD